MNGLEWHVGKERLIPMGFDETDGFVGDSVGRLRVVPCVGGRAITGRIIEQLVARQPRAETLRVGRVIPLAQVPLAGKERRVARFAKPLGDGHLLQREMILKRRRLQPACAVASNKVGDPRARRVLSRHDAGPRRRADRTGGIALCESHAARRQTVNIRSLIERLWVIRPDVHIAEIVGQDQDDVRPRSVGG